MVVYRNGTTYSIIMFLFFGGGGGGGGWGLLVIAIGKYRKLHVYHVS